MRIAYQPSLSFFLSIVFGLCLAFPVAAEARTPAEGDAGDEIDNNPGIDQRLTNGMHVIVTGVGARVYAQNDGGSGVLIVIDGDVLQFDMGPLTVDRMAEAGVHPNAVDYLFISHLHMDHISDFVRFISLNTTTGGNARVLGPLGTSAMADGANRMLTADSGMLSRLTTMSADYVVEELTKGGVVVETEKFTVTVAPTAHFDIRGPHSFAYRVDSDYGSVVVSGDTVPSLNVVELAKGADLLVHEAVFDRSMLPEKELSNETLAGLTDYGRDLVRRPQPTLSDRIRDFGFGHTEISEAAKVAAAAEVDTLVIYHRPPFAATQSEMRLARTWGLAPTQTDPRLIAEFLAAAKEHFDGTVILGTPLLEFEFSKAAKPASQ